MRRFILILFLLILISSELFAISQTGKIIFLVKSVDGELASGATIEISSSEMMGERAERTNSRGRAVFNNLPSGVYSAMIKLEGFVTYKIDDILLQPLDRVTIDIYMKPGPSSEMITSTDFPYRYYSAASNSELFFDFDNYINHMPITRHYTDVVEMGGGVYGAKNPSVFGGGSYDNLYLIDGINVIDSRTHVWGSLINMDIVQGISLQLGGITAEYGYFMGSVLNVLTRSGSNILHGIARLEITRNSWNDSDINIASNPNPVREWVGNDEWSFSGGGPIIPGYVWWFAGYTEIDYQYNFLRLYDPVQRNYIRSSRPQIGHFFSIKGTAQIGHDVRAFLSYREDPVKTYNENSYSYFSNVLQPSADQGSFLGGEYISASVSASLSSASFIEACWGSNRRSSYFFLQDDDPEGRWSRSTDVGPTYKSVDNWRWGSVPRDYSYRNNTDLYEGSINFLLHEPVLNDHDIKFGMGQTDHWIRTREIDYPGGEYILTGRVQNYGYDVAPHMERYIVIDHLPEAESHSKYWSIYLQDSINPAEFLTVNLGIRSDLSSLINNHDVEIWNTGLLDALAPRIGVALGFESSVLRLFYGRYYDIFASNLVDSFNTYDVPERWYYYEPTDTIDGRNGWTLVESWLRGTGGYDQMIAPDLTPQYMDEIMIDFDWSIWKNITVGLTGIWRVFLDGVVAQDIDGNRDYRFENLKTDDYGSKWKEFLGLVFNFRKRPAGDNLFLSGSFIIRNEEGLDENATMSIYATDPLKRYDNASEWWGPASDPTLHAKLQAVYFFPNGWYAGIRFDWHNGTQYSTVDWEFYPGFGWIMYYPNGKGDMKRNPGVYNIDLQFGIEQDIKFPFNVPLTDNEIKLGIYANIFNLTNNQIETSVQVYEESATYGQPVSWKSPRSYQLGFRIEF